MCSLPRRQLNERDAAARAATLTPELRLRGSLAALRPWQGFCLAEAVACGGALLGLPVGFGKTLLTLLLGTMFGATRPVLVLPASLRDKTWAEFGALLKDWNLGPGRTPPKLISIEELERESGADLLERIKPDLIIIDECDELANPQASATRRLDRYIVKYRTQVNVVCMTGTLSRKSIMNYWHLLCWCLDVGAPVPLVQSEADQWAMALDEQKRRQPARMSPGVLGATVELAREWYRNRLLETPGVVIVDGDSCDAPLTVRVRLAREDPILDREYKLFLGGDLKNGRPALETPEGVSVSDPLSRWRIDGQYGCGLYLRWKKQPPDEWRDAYREKNRFVRDMIAKSNGWAKPLDTELQVLRRFEDHEIIAAWRRIKDTFQPETEAVWLSTSTIESVRDWLAEDAAPGIVWTGCTEFAEALAMATRLPYYGPKGRNQWGGGLHSANTSLSMIASWHANKRGFNLQPWRRQLLVMPPQSAKYLEQIFGRSHRAGQTEHVIVDVLATSGGTLDALESAINEACFARDTVGMTQKLLRAQVQWATPRITTSNAYRWGRKGGTTAAASTSAPRSRFSALAR